MPHLTYFFKSTGIRVNVHSSQLYNKRIMWVASIRFMKNQTGTFTHSIPMNPVQNPKWREVESAGSEKSVKKKKKKSTDLAVVYVRPDDNIRDPTEGFTWFSDGIVSRWFFASGKRHEYWKQTCVFLQMHASFSCVSLSLKLSRLFHLTILKHWIQEKLNQ